MKEEIVHRKVLNTILALEVSKGHLRWKVTEVARISKVKRPLIYYHFGKSKKKILETCIEVIGDDYFGLAKDREHTLLRGEFVSSMQKTREMFLANPALAVFYQRWRMENSPLRESLKKIEQRYQKKIHLAYPDMTSVQVRAFHALLHGAITAPFLDDESFKEVCRAIARYRSRLNG